MATEKENAQPADAKLQERVQLFDRELQGLQQKYGLRLLAQVAYPDGAVLSVPIRVVPLNVQAAPAPEAEGAATP